MIGLSLVRVLLILSHGSRREERKERETERKGAGVGNVGLIMMIILVVIWVNQIATTGCYFNFNHSVPDM